MAWKVSHRHHLFLTITTAEWQGQLPLRASRMQGQTSGNSYLTALKSILYYIVTVDTHTQVYWLKTSKATVCVWPTFVYCNVSGEELHSDWWESWWADPSRTSSLTDLSHVLHEGHVLSSKESFCVSATQGINSLKPHRILLSCEHALQYID